MAETCRLRIYSILQIAQKNGEKLMFVSCKYPFSTSLEEFYFHELFIVHPSVHLCSEGFCVFLFFLLWEGGLRSSAFWIVSKQTALCQICLVGTIEVVFHGLFLKEINGFIFDLIMLFPSFATPGIQSPYQKMIGVYKNHLKNAKYF